MKNIHTYTREFYCKNCDPDLEAGVKYVVVGVYECGDDYEETCHAGYIYEDGTVMIIGCRSDFKVDYVDLLDYLYDELDDIEASYTR